MGSNGILERDFLITRCYAINVLTTKKLTTPIIIQRAIANNKGFMPTFLIVEIDKPAPIKNNVKINPFLANHAKVLVSSCGREQYVFITMAIINRKINQGIDMRFDLSRNISIVIRASGIIQRARVSFINVAVCKAIGP